jgi:hypothetical protein
MPPDEKAGFYSKVEPFGMLWAAHFEFAKAMLTSTVSVHRRLKIIKSERFSKCQSLMQRTEYPNARLL